MKKIFFLVFLAISFLSCRKEKTYWDADIVAPVATSSLSLSNLFPDTLLEANSGGQLSINFEAELFRLAADTLLELPDTSFKNVFGPVMFQGGYFNYQPGQTLYSSANNLVSFQIANGIKLKEAVIRSGKVHLEVRNPLRQPTEFICSVGSAELNGVPLLISLTVPAGTQASPAYRDTFVTVDNYHVDFSGNDGTKTNTISQSLIFKIAPNAVTDTLKYGDTLKSLITFVDLIPDYGRGYFGNQTLTLGPDTAIFDVFNQISSGSLGLDSANIQVQMQNEFGVDLRSNLTAVQSISPINASVNLTGSNIGTSFNVGRAIATGNPASPVTPYNKTIAFTNTNSNINQFIGNLPNSISYALSSQINPLGNISGYNDFVYYGTNFKADLKAHVPLRFSANNIVLRDTTEFNVSALSEEIDKVNEGKLILKATNSYPFSLAVTGILLDENNQPIEPLISAPNNLVNAPVVNASNVVVAPQETIIEIYFDKGKFESIKKARKIAYYITFNTTNQPNAVAFLNWYKLDLLLTADFNYSVNK
ncbi:MAG: hypothetical protein Q8M29_11600 [Bacteroidota bacterium]|nr:hypothetical protein [Bacteroidota bacterium]